MLATEGEKLKIKKMRKRIILAVIVSFTTFWARAQWTDKDSLNLERMLKGEEELKLNQEAVRQIDFGNAAAKPRMSEEKNWTLPDATLPKVLPKKNVRLTLRPYTAMTRYDWDPVYKRKVRVDKDTWRAAPLEKLYKYLFPANGEHRAKDRRILADEMMLGTPNVGGIPLGGGVSVNGGTIGGLDLMAIFTKDFWDKKGRERRARTMEVLRFYGDSTSALINHPIEPTTR